MTLFFLTAEYYPIVCMHICIIHPSVEGHLGCFRLSAIVTREAMDITEQEQCQVLWPDEEWS